MKNAFSILALMMACSARLSAASDWVVPALNLTFHNTVPNKGVASQYPRVPARFPIIGQEGHTFTFEYPGCFSSVELVEEGSGETVVYEMAVDEATTQITVPEEFQGEYEIRFYSTTYYLSCTVEL